MKTFKQILENSNPYSNSRKVQNIPKDPNTLRRVQEEDNSHSLNIFNRLNIPLNYIHSSLKGQANMSLILKNMTKYKDMSERLAIHHPEYSDQHLVDVNTVRNLIRTQIKSHPVLIRKISQLPSFAKIGRAHV